MTNSRCTLCGGGTGPTTRIVVSFGFGSGVCMGIESGMIDIGMLLGWGIGSGIGARRVEAIIHIPKTEIGEWEASIVMVIHV